MHAFIVQQLGRRIRLGRGAISQILGGIEAIPFPSKKLYYWPLPLDFQTFLRSLTILTTGATEADKAELGLELRLGSIIVVDPLSLPLYEIR